jgi:acetyl-CoA C-acetyltransferase
MTRRAQDALPAVAGAAQVVQRPDERDDLADAQGPIELMVDAARAAAADAGSLRLLDGVGWIGVAGGWWRYRNPGQLVGEQLDVPDAATALTPISGTAPQDLLAFAAERIARGQLEVALVVGGEAHWTQQRLARANLEPTWITAPGDGEPETTFGFPAELMDEVRVLGSAPAAYAVLDDGLRVAGDESVDDHRDRIAELWSRFSVVAAENPYAWDRSVTDAAAIRDPSPDNRMIAFPYTKAMVANNTVDMASALLLCSARTAAEHGVDTDRLVFPHVVTSSHETWTVAQRDELHGCPALATAGEVAWSHAGLGPDDVEHVDLYACFPAIVQMAAAALGLAEDRPLTVTGGLGFAGAPVGNSTGHAIAAIVAKVRRGGVGLVHGNGGNATKHSVGIYSSSPPRRFVREDVQARVDLRPRDTLDPGWEGPVTVEAATVVFDRQGPEHVLAAVRDDRGARGWAFSQDPELMAMAMTEGLADRRGHRGEGRRFALASLRRS